MSSSTVERPAFNRHDAGSTPVSPTDLHVKQMPTILQLEDFMPLIQAEALRLNEMSPERREETIELHRIVDERFDEAVLCGTGGDPLCP